MPSPVARATSTWSRHLLVVALLAVGLLAAGPVPADAASAKPPAGLAVTATTPTSTTLAWRPVPRATGYRLQYSTSSKMKKAHYQRATGTTGTIAGLKPGRTYHVKVRALGRKGSKLSRYSKAVEVTTTAATPVPPTDPVPVETPAPRVHVPGRLNLPDHPAVLLIGDSYTEGVGAVPLANGYAYKVAEPLGWTLTRDGRGGSGYVNPTGYGAGVFGDRLPTFPADAYDLVVLQGSSNDMKYPSAEIATNVAAALRTVHDRFPHAEVLLVGPTNPYGSPLPDLVRVNELVRAAAVERGIAFVDPITEEWFVPGDGRWAANPANAHPSNAGYQRIADRLVADVRSLSCNAHPADSVTAC